MADFQPPANATLNEQGFWVTPDGDLVPGQETPGERDLQAQGTDRRIQFDDQGRPFMLQNGSRLFISPQTAQGYASDPRIQQWLARPENTRPDGTLWHQDGQWNTQTGQWDQPFNWNTVAVLGAGAGIAAPFIAGAAAGGAGAGAEGGAGVGGASGAGAGGTLASSTIAPTLGTLPAGVASGAVPAALGTGAEVAGDAAAGGALASHAIAPTTGALPAGTASGAVPSALGPAAAAGGLTTAQRIAQMLQGGGQAIGAASQASGDRRRYDDVFNLAIADEQNQRAKEQDQRSVTEASQRKQAMADAYRASWYANRRPGPFDPTTPQPLTPEFSQTLNTVGAQGRAQLANPARYATAGLADPPPLPTQTQPGTMEQVGSWLSPTLSTIGTIARYL